MIDERFAEQLPRPLRPGRMLLLLALPLLALVQGLVVMSAASLRGFSELWCEASAPPDLMAGLLFAGLILVVGVLPLWLLFPPSRPALVVDEHGLLWDRPHLTGGTGLLLVTLLVLGVGLATSVWTSRGIEWKGDGQRLGACDDRQAWVAQAVRARKTRGLAIGLGYLGLLGLACWQVHRRWRPADQLALDELGLRLNGQRWSFKDLTRAEVVDGALHLEAHDGRSAALRLFPGETGAASQLALEIRRHLPQHTEERTGAQQALSDLAQRRSPPTG